jgi:hypothetical protein
MVLKPISMVYKKGLKDGKTHCCFMRMVRMELQWIRTFIDTFVYLDRGFVLQ